MKKLFIAALMVVSLATSAFAAETNKVNSSVSYNFNIDFKNATNVTWTTAENYSKATFVLNNEKMEAFYNEDGSIIGTSKSVDVDELSINTKRTIAKRFTGYTVKEAIKFTGTEESAYYIAAENEQESVVLKVTDKQVSTLKRTTK